LTKGIHVRPSLAQGDTDPSNLILAGKTPDTIRKERKHTVLQWQLNNPGIQLLRRAGPHGG